MKDGFAVWLTGLSGSGKSTIARALSDELTRAGCAVEVLDGDEMRTYLCKGLGFSKEDRDTNIARIGYVASLLVRHGAAVITAAISPYAQARADARERIGPCVEIYVRCSIDELERRDTKGLYAKALRGELEHFTGISDPYEAPENPDLTLDTQTRGVVECVDDILALLKERGFVDARVEAVS